MEDYYWKDWLKNRNWPETTKKILSAILSDLWGRYGFDSEWEETDACIQKEIMLSLAAKVNEILRGTE